MMLDNNDKPSVAGKEDEFSMGRANLKISSRGTAPVEESKLRVTLEFTGHAIDKKGVAVQDMRLLLSAPQASAKIDKVYAGNHSQSKEIDGAGVTISFGNLGHKEKHRVLVDLILPAVNGRRRVVARVLKITYSYCNEEGKLLVANPATTTVIRTGSILEKKSDEVNLPQATEEIDAAFTARPSQDIKSPNNKKKEGSVAPSRMASHIQNYVPVAVAAAPSEYQISDPSDLPPKASDHQSSPIAFPEKTTQGSQSSSDGGDTINRPRNIDNNYPEKPSPKKDLGVDTSPHSGPSNYKKLLIFSVICLLSMTMYFSTRETSVVNLSFVSLPNLLKNTLSQLTFFSQPIEIYHEPDKSSGEEPKEPQQTFFSQPIEIYHEPDKSSGDEPKEPQQTFFSQPIEIYHEPDKSSGEESEEPQATSMDDGAISVGSPTTDLGHYTHKLSLLSVVTFLALSVIIYYSKRDGRMLKLFSAISIAPGYVEHASRGLNYYMNKLGMFFKFLMDVKQKFSINSLGRAFGRLGHYKKLQIFSVMIVIVAVIMCYRIRWSAVLKMLLIPLAIAIIFVIVVGFWKLVAAIILKLYRKNFVNSAESAKETRVMAKIRNTGDEEIKGLAEDNVPQERAVAGTSNTIKGLNYYTETLHLFFNYIKNAYLEQAYLVHRVSAVTTGLSYYRKHFSLSLIAIILMLTLLIYYSIIRNVLLKMLSTSLAIAFVTLAIVTWSWKRDLSNLVMTVKLKVFHKQNTQQSAEIIEQSTVTDRNKAPNNSPNVVEKDAMQELAEDNIKQEVDVVPGATARAHKYILEKLPSFFSSSKDAFLRLTKTVFKNPKEQIHRLEEYIKQEYIKQDYDADRVSRLTGAFHYYWEMSRSSLALLTLSFLMYFSTRASSVLIMSFTAVIFALIIIVWFKRPFMDKQVKSKDMDDIQPYLIPVEATLDDPHFAIGHDTETNGKQNLINITVGGLSYYTEKLHLPFNFPAYFEQAKDTFKRMFVVNPLSLATGGLSFYKETLILFSATMLSVLALIICYSIRWSEVFNMYIKALPIAFLTFFTLVMFRKYSMAARTVSRMQK